MSAELDAAPAWRALAGPSAPIPDPPADAEALIRENFRPICAYLAPRLGRDLADDLTAEVFARALANLHSYDRAPTPFRLGLAAKRF
jgi:DNA-directed RNA polymerase specialized sigma24 family protein